MPSYMVCVYRGGRKGVVGRVTLSPLRRVLLGMIWPCGACGVSISSSPCEYLSSSHSAGVWRGGVFMVEGGSCDIFHVLDTVMIMVVVLVVVVVVLYIQLSPLTSQEC